MDKFFNTEKILNFCNYVYWFLITNILFILINIPSVLFLYLVGYTDISSYLPLFLISLLPLGPSLTALFYVMGKLIKNGTINPVGDFFRGLKINFIQSIIFTIAELILIFMLYSNFRFFSNFSFGVFINTIFYLISIIIVLITPIIYMLISRFDMPIKNILKASLTLCITRPILTIANIAAFAFMLILFEIIASFAVLCMFSIFSYLIMYMNKALLIELENLSIPN